MTESTIEFEVSPHGVATLWFNRPEVNNAYDGALINDLKDALLKLEQDSNVRLILVRGRGRHFQAGADLAWISQVREADWQTNVEVSRSTTNAVYALTICTKPTIALIHGACMGGGTGLAAACDIVIAEKSARFAISEARLGLIATPILPQLISRIGPARLRRYALSCETFDAERALAIGLVDEIAEEKGLDEKASPIIDSILHCPPRALMETKKAILKHSSLYFNELEREEIAQPHAAKRLTEEAGEGLQSFHEKRKPSWYPGD